MKNKLQLMLLILLMPFFLDSCMIAGVRTTAAQGNSERPVQLTYHRLFWGFGTGKFPIGSCPSNALQSVQMKTNFWEAVVTIATLGIYCPVEVCYVCAKKDSPDPIH